MYNLLKGSIENDNAPQNRENTREVMKKGVPSHKTIKWSEEHQHILERLIDCLVEPPVLGFPDFSQLFILHTEASNNGLGAVLYQCQNGKLCVIANGSRTLPLKESVIFIQVNWNF